MNEHTKEKCKPTHDSKSKVYEERMKYYSVYEWKEKNDDINKWREDKPIQRWTRYTCQHMH